MAEGDSLRAQRFRRRVLMGAGVSTVPLYLILSMYSGWAMVATSPRPTAVSPGSIGARYEDVSFPSRDNLLLRGWLFHAPVSNHRSIIMVHGSRGTRADNADFAAIMIARGFDVLLFDLRGCGASPPALQTYGTRESWDVEGAYDFMVRRGYPPSRMALFGISEGAATVIVASAKLPKVGAVIADSAYADVWSIVGENGIAGVARWPAVGFAALISGFNPALRPIDVVRASPHRAFLFIQGTLDQTVSSSDAAAMKAASGNPATQVAYFRAGHVGSLYSDPARYVSVVTSFIASQTR